MRVALIAGGCHRGDPASMCFLSEGGPRHGALVDQAINGEVVLNLDTDDAVVFNQALVHCWTDNRSAQTRVAATAHFARAGTVDRSIEVLGANPFNDWMPWLRDGTLVAGS